MRDSDALTIRHLPLEPWSDAEIANAECALGQRERREFSHFTHPQRRRQWLAGRWLVKQLLNDMQVAAADCELLSRDARSLGTRPRALVGEREVAVSISLAHDAQGVLACVSRERAVGVDLVEPGVRGDGFYRSWFHDRERRWIDGDRAQRGPLVWSIKEATYKAMNQGEGWNPRAVEVICDDDCIGSAAILYQGQLLDERTIEWSEWNGQGAVVVTMPLACHRNSTEAQVALCS